MAGWYALDLPWLLKWKQYIGEASEATGFEPALLAAIMSRESGGGRLLKPKGPGGKGDRGYGRGLMQIDTRSHTFAKSGNWTDPRANILYGANLLLDYYQRAKSSGLSPAAALKAALAGYNRGITGSIKDAKAGRDPDRGTTGKNYSKDVLGRAAILASQFGRGAQSARGAQGKSNITFPAFLAALAVAL